MKTISQKFILSFVFLLVSIGAFTQNSLSLAEAIKKGLENNYEIRISALDVDVSKNNNSWGSAGLFPSVKLSALQSNRSDFSSPSRTGFGNDDEYSTTVLSPSVSVSWLMFSGFSVKIRKDKFEMLQEMSEGNSIIIVENTIQGIILSYYKILLEKKKLETLTEVQKLSKDRYNYLLLKKEIGAVVTYDVLQAKNAYLSDSSVVLIQQMNLKNAYMNFSLILGEQTNTIYDFTDEFQIQFQDYHLEDIMSKMLSSNQNLKNQHLQLNIMKNSTSLSKAAIYPTLALSSAYDNSTTKMKYVGQNAINYNAYDYYVGFSINFNLFNGGNTRRAIKNAKIQEDMSAIQVEQVKHNMSIQLTNSFELYNVQKQIYSVSDEGLKTAELSLQISNEKFKAGAINSFNYRDVQLMYLNAAFNKLEATYNLIQTNTELLRLTGGIISNK